MKHQYFGDLGDYKKYSLLKQLSITFNIIVCWMLTEDDNTNDGRHIQYLKDPAKWKSFDKDLFSLMRMSVIDRGLRNLSVIETAKLIPNAAFFSKRLEDTLKSRKDYFKEFESICKGENFIFFDPDNGIEVNSVSMGDKNSKKYIYLDELKNFFLNKYNLLIYQHFPRQKRNTYIRNLVIRLQNQLGTDIIYTIQTRHAVFMLIVQEDKNGIVEDLLFDFSSRWGREICISRHNIQGFTFIESMKGNVLNEQLDLF